MAAREKALTSIADPSTLPDHWRETSAEDQARTRHIADLIAGMTDRYALSRYRELIGPPPIEGC